MQDFFIEATRAHAGVISDSPSIASILFNVLQFLLSVVAIVAILSIVITGIRYVLVHDMNQAEGIKKSLVAIIIGLVIVIGSIIIVSAIGKFLQ